METDSLKYHRDKYDLKKEKPNRSLSYTSRMIEDNSSVMEIGCSTGYFSQHLKEDKNCEVLGVDISSGSVEVAKSGGVNAFVINVENDDIIKFLGDYTTKNKKFDYIIINDVLEHLREPQNLLMKLKPFLNENGSFIVSVPNVAYWKIRLGLLFGNFDYTNTGILDNTHLKFFTQKTLKQLIKNCGFKIIEWENVYSWIIYSILKYKTPLRNILQGWSTFQMVVKIK